MQNKHNYLFIDLLRSWAMIIMIEVHVFNAFLQPIIREAPWFVFLNFINGMVAPSFIFISGFAFVVSSEKNISDMRSFGGVFRKRLFRTGQIFLTGYLIHIPTFSLRNIIYYTDEASFKSFYKVDVLQCIGAGILLLIIARMLILSDKLYQLYTIISAAVIVLLAPFVWDIDFNRILPVPLACYFNEIHGSFFPIFPWLGFLFSGAAIALIVRKKRENDMEEKFIIKLAVAGVFCIALSSPVLYVLKNYYWFEIKSSPFFFVQRLGVIFVLLYLLRLYVSSSGERKSYFYHIGRESLLIYWFHLLIIYRIFFNGRSINDLVNNAFGLSECIAAATSMIVLMLAVAVIWGRIKEQRPDTARIIFIVFIITGLLYICLF